MPHPSPPIIDPRLLDLLLRADGPVTVQALASRLDLPLPKVRRELDRLRDAGCELDAHPQHGVTLVRSGLSAWVDYLHHRLGGRIIECYRRTGSTQDAARRLLSRGAGADGAVVTADEQDAGRGRLGRRWVAPPGACVMFSRVVAGARGGGVDRLTFVASVAVARAMEAFIASRGLRATIKWPNDVQVRGWKIAGILVEAAADGAVIGVGINTHLLPHQMPRELDGRVTSLAMLGVEVDRLLVLAEVLRQIDAALAEPTDTLLREWRERSTMLHHHVTLRCDGRDVTGEVIDLDPADGLIVRRDTGEIVHLPAATTTVIQ